ncbi:hypothetical protein TraAM80_06584 [Trypanosoma rangeli]|uniref:Uncharacterized protein n=1 Tax=Trypanosoma rangeli TaxID=5698 RepID=A0A3R7MGJ1_TRYRA|nr:uncharacterized protein TraAM80_06584 [Trypanosoma rangeli]RNF02124.1 hypothetical protein TraAM80_06584 [Trypanosoma rangeli]|eukprot:RNF02124.1 hypothetical protein TraAM80_06584 [Trypanosoma rangeli]
MNCADVGIFLCCLVSIACKVRLLTETQTAGSAALGLSAPEAERIAQACSTSASRRSFTPPFAAAAVGGAAATRPTSVLGGRSQLHTSVDMGGHRGGPHPPGYDYSAPLCEDEVAGAAVDDADVCYRADDDDSGNDNAEDATDGADPTVRLYSLSLTQRIMVGVNWLSVISNCLTYFLRPSQVLYAFLLCSSDMMLYVVTDPAVGRRRRRRSPLLRSLGLTPAMHLGGAAATAMAVGLDVGEGSYHTSVWAERCAEARQKPSSKMGFILSAKQTTDAHGDAGIIPSHASRLDHACGRQKLKTGVKCVPRLIHQRGLFLVAVNMVFLFALILFHLHHLFFWVGTVTGYLAACGTLYVLGCDVGLLLQVFGWLRFGRSFRVPSAPSSFSPVAVVAALSSVDLFSASLPPAGAMLNRQLRVLYATQLVFSFACSAFYFSMLLEEGAALYSTHLEFMRWYVGTVGLGLLDLARLLLFGSILWLGAGWDEKKLTPLPA